MNARKFIKKAAYEVIVKKPVEDVTLKEILSVAEVSKQTFYRYYKDKYELANEIYAQLTQQGIIEPEKIQNEDDWRNLYLKQFAAFREHMDFVRHLYSSRETGCTVDFEIASTIRFDKAILSRKGADLKNPRIIFAIEAKDVGGTYAMSTDKGIADAMIAKGYDLENIYKTIEKLSPSMIKAVDVKRLVGEKTEAASMAVAR